VESGGEREFASVLRVLLKFMLTYVKGGIRWFLSNGLCPGSVRVVPGPGMGNLQTYTILSHIFFMSLKLSLILACLSWMANLALPFLS
jgi:hypothetical protein